MQRRTSDIQEVFDKFCKEVEESRSYSRISIDRSRRRSGLEEESFGKLNVEVDHNRPFDTSNLKSPEEKNLLDVDLQEEKIPPHELFGNLRIFVTGNSRIVKIIPDGSIPPEMYKDNKNPNGDKISTKWRKPLNTKPKTLEERLGFKYNSHDESTFTESDLNKNSQETSDEIIPPPPPAAVTGDAPTGDIIPISPPPPAAVIGDAPTGDIIPVPESLAVESNFDLKQTLQENSIDYSPEESTVELDTFDNLQEFETDYHLLVSPLQSEQSGDSQITSYLLEKFMQSDLIINPRDNSTNYPREDSTS